METLKQGDYVRYIGHAGPFIEGEGWVVDPENVTATDSTMPHSSPYISNERMLADFKKEISSGKAIFVKFLNIKNISACVLLWRDNLEKTSAPSIDKQVYWKLTNV